MDTHSTFTDRYLSKDEAVAYTGLGSRTLDKLVEKGELVAFKPRITGTRNRKTLFRKSYLDAWLEKYRINGLDEKEDK